MVLILAIVFLLQDVREGWLFSNLSILIEHEIVKAV